MAYENTAEKNLSPDGLIELYRSMLRIRLCEESFVDPILNKEIRCPVHLYTGQEAVAVGVCAALTEADYVFGTHRSHGHYLAKGGSLQELVAEVYCRETGCSKGRGGSMHLTAPEKGVLGVAPIVAGTISLATGAALAAKIRGDGRVAVSFFGDGATGEGVFWESLNFASLRRLPILFVCENNLYSTHMPILECARRNHFADVGVHHEVECIQVDGNDVLEVYAAATKAVSRCRAGEGPVFMECKTYRLRGHVGPDDNIQGTHTDIRPPEEVAEWRRRDPLKRFRERLLDQGVATAEQLTAMEEQIQKEVDDAHALAKSQPSPNPEDLAAYVFK